MGHRLKSCVLMFVGMALLAFTGCGGAAANPPPVHNEWTWMSGSNIVNQSGTYGTQSTAAADNTPGARAYASTWTDASGDLWLFGGYGDASGMQGDLNDLWEYTNGKWTWISGSNQTEQPGSYGTLGLPSPNNHPGARYQAVSWTDISGNFWLFGGLGIDSTGNRGDLNDLWRYSDGEWTWMSGSNTVAVTGQAGVYGTQGAPAPGNTPAARVDANSWADAFGNLWLFGGFGRDSTGTLGILNDLWKYSNGEWTWMSGSNKGDQYGIYGTEGTAAASDAPGARTNAVTWTDASGNLWLFGGQGNDLNGLACPSGDCNLNDLWKYSGGEWIWMGGPNIANEPGTYGTRGVAAPGNVPPPRWGGVGWTDAAGNFWLFGGDAGPGYDFNDLWRYSNGEWTWMSGSNQAVQLGAYGTQGVTAPGNVPGARDSAVGWIDRSGNLWLFGGEDTLSIGLAQGGGKFNDLWKYQP